MGVLDAASLSMQTLGAFQIAHQQTKSSTFSASKKRNKSQYNESAQMVHYKRPKNTVWNEAHYT